MQKTAGILLTIGTFVYGAGELLLVKFGYGDPQLMVQRIHSDPTGWLVTMVLWGGGSAILVLGLGVFARHVHRISQDRNVRIASTLGAAIAAVGALAWIIRCYNGAVLPPDELLNNPSRWLDILFMAYSILTQIALIITGFVLLRSGYPKWLGWVVLVFGGLLLVMWILLGGGPPGLNNIPLLVMGIVLLRLRSRSPQPSFEPA